LRLADFFFDRSLLIILFKETVFTTFQHGKREYEMNRKLRVGVCCALVALVFVCQPLIACFTIVVGKDASSNGSVLVGHDEQNTGNLSVNFRKIPRMHYSKDAMVDLKNGGKIPQVAETNAFLWSEIPGATSSDGYLNEFGVVIVSDFCPDRMPNLSMLEKEGQIKNGGLAYLLRRFVAERAKTAREGVQIIGDLIDKYGYVSNRTFVIADPNEAWLMAVTKGNKWVAERVPDDQVALLPNVYTIQDVNPQDTKNFVVSKDLIKYATEKGWYNPEKTQVFNFLEVYSEPREQLMDPRHWLSEGLITQKKIDRSPDRRLPFSVKPAKKISVQDIMAVLRHTNTDNYMNKMYDIATVDGKKKDPENWQWRNICLRRTQEGGVFELSSKLPPAIGCIYWRTSAAPNTGILTPWYIGTTDTPDSYYYSGDLDKVLTADYHFNPKTYSSEPNYKKAWWIFRKLQAQVDRDSMQKTSIVRKIWDKEENRLITDQSKVQAEAMKLYKKNKSAAYKYLTVYCNDVAAKVVNQAQQLSKKFPKLKGNPNDVLDPGAKPIQICSPTGETSPAATD